MLSKETGIDLPILVPQSFRRPEGEPFQFCPDQRVWIALEEQNAELTLDLVARHTVKSERQSEHGEGGGIQVLLVRFLSTG